MTQPATPSPLPYDPEQLALTMAHIGVGAFHRAHQQSYYNDLACAGELTGVVGINLTPPDLASQYNNQNRRYCVLTEDNHESRVDQIGTLRELHDASTAPEVCWDPISFVTLTITEPGYCHKSGTTELDWDVVAKDLASPETPMTAIGYLAWMLECRRRANGAPITLASCDNLPKNGKLLQAVMEQYVSKAFPELLPWMDENVCFPVSMVDRIVPAMSDASRQKLQDACGHADQIGVVAEPFRQWVIEDKFAAARPALEKVGVTVVPDVAPYAKMKYRLLNGIQSAYAEIGRLCGLETSFDASTCPELADWARVFHASQCSTLMCPQGEDLADYSRVSLQRLQNPCIYHPLNQIASNASFKLPQRIAEPVDDLIRKGREHAAEPQAMVFAAWAVNGGNTSPDSKGISMSDPMSSTISNLCDLHEGNAYDLAKAVLALPIFPQTLQTSVPFVQLVGKWIERFAMTDHAGRIAAIGAYAGDTAHD
nr:mannitol dehydrogenase family protein [uncultured Cohaesibacter sp.]